MERFRDRRSQRPGPTGPAIPMPGGPAAPTDPSELPPGDGSAGVRVIHGPTLLDAPVAGLTVAEARTMFATSLGLDDGIDVVVDGEDAAPDMRLQRGSTLEFVHRTGEKG